MARPRKKIDPVQVEKLGRIGCTNEEMALILECSTDTLVRRFADLIQKSRAARKMSLRHKQTQMALEGNVSMLIWLGKQDLKQRDKFEDETKDDAHSAMANFTAALAGITKTIMGDEPDGTEETTPSSTVPV